MAEWKLSNGDIIIYDGEWTQQDKAESLSERIGIQSPEIQSHAFKKLKFRFRIHDNQTHIPELELNHHDQIYQGSGAVDINHHLTGAIQNMADQSICRSVSPLTRFVKPAIQQHP